MTTIALIGLGEVGSILAQDMSAFGEVVAYDIAFADESSRASQNARRLGVTMAASHADAASGAALCVSAVTASRCLDAARATAPGMSTDSWFLDLNSSSPRQKEQAFESMSGSAGRYVEAALMSPVGPRRLASPFLLGGPYAEAFVAEGRRFGLTNLTFFSSRVGAAAATKLCRSVVTKGLEALFAESLLAARRYGVEREVLDSLSNILPPADWDLVATYFISRSVEHGARRGEEMEEAARTVADTGIDPVMSEATVLRQRWAAARIEVSATDDLMTLADRLLTTVPEPGVDG